MIDNKLEVLLNMLLEDSIQFLKDNGYDNVDKIRFSADGLLDGMTYGKDCPSVDNYVYIYDKQGNRIGMYL